MRCQDPIIERVVAKMRHRSTVGVSKYGTTMAESREQIAARVRHLQAELMDGAAYCEWILQQLEDRG